MSESDPSHLSDLYEQMIGLMAKGHSPEKALQTLTGHQEKLYGKHPDLLEERLTALAHALQKVREQQNKVKFLQKKAVRFDRTQWYLGPALDDSLWERLRERLVGAGRSAAEIELVDRDSTAVVGLLDDPGKDSLASRGLVVGHVQSGKTGNIAAVINKAADTPYKFFLVLSGMTDQLRNQTQQRLDRDIVALEPSRWMQWTEADTDSAKGDFSHKATGGFSFDSRNQLAVVKKNAGVLRRFLAKLKNTNEATLRATPFLVIDDECDQASVNSAKYADAVTRINELIRQILTRLPRSAYAGYTATPFANVLIDPSIPDDLYPRDFIYALERPKAYFGASELFGRAALDGEYVDELADGYDMIREVPDEDIKGLRPKTRKGVPVEIEVTPSLAEAIHYYAMVIAARWSRGQTDRHNTMLLHTSVLNSVHRATEKVVRPYVASFARRIAANEEGLLRQMKEQWEREQSSVMSEEFDLVPVPFKALTPHLAKAAAAIDVHVENWTTQERLSYDNGPHCYLVIGGNVLARGLTLEGLTVSYFLRSSSQYDTLMQMGRWFGYRPGFEDLPRVWVEERVREAFFDLATVEMEIRNDIARYAEEQITPTQFGVRIRKIPGMAITAPAKMRSAVPVQIGYAGTHVQTFRFKRKNAPWLASNWAAGAALVARAGADALGGAMVAAEHVAEFLRAYQPHETHLSLQPAFLVEYILKAAQRDPRVATWTVAVVEGRGAESRQPLGPLGRVATVVRSAEKSTGDDASVKAIMSRQDVLLGLGLAPAQPLGSWEELKRTREEAGGHALLVLYPIEALSAPVRTKSNVGAPSREPLDAVTDVLGYGIVFPGDGSLAGTYVSAPIVPEQAEPTDDLEEGDRIPDDIVDPSQGSAT